MRLQNTTNETQVDDGNVLVPSNTTMVTSTVRPEPTGKLKNNVKIVVENKNVREETGTKSQSGLVGPSGGLAAAFNISGSCITIKQLEVSVFSLFTRY